MTWVSTICFGVCFFSVSSLVKSGADPLSPARLFGFIWSLAIALAEFKFSSFQHEWNAQSWLLLLTGVGGFLLGTFITYVVNFETKMVPISIMRKRLKSTKIHEPRLFWFILVSVGVYTISYMANYLIRGWLPLFVIGTNISRVDFNVSGLTLFIYSAPFIFIFTVAYYLLVRGNRGRKLILATLSVATLFSFIFLLQRYQIIMAAVVCFALLFYASKHIRWRTAFPFFLGIGAFFFWMSSLRLSHVVATFLYSASRMKFSKDYAMLTEPYMYLVMNLENFARSVNRADYHTYGYFTFDFITAIAGLKYWIVDYFGLDRTPYLNSSYNTYTAFWWFYSDFGVVGLAVVPILLGLGISTLYYRMRSRPTIDNVIAYGVMVFVMLISYFNFPFALLWFEFNMLALFLILRWTKWMDHASSERN